MNERTKNRINTRSVLKVINAVAVSLVILTFCITLLSAAYVNEWGYFSDLVFDYIFLIFALVTSINIHEFGHLVFGKILGFCLISYSIGPFLWINENGKMRFSVRKNKGYGGQCSMMPPEQNLSDYQYGLYYAGGIIFNMLSACTLAILYMFMPNASRMTELFFVNAMSFWMILALLNLLPLILGSSPTDGKLIRCLMFNEPYAEKLKSVNSISTALSSGYSPKNIPMTYMPDTEKPDTLDMMLLLYNYFKALDSCNNASAISYAGMIEKNLHAFPNNALPSIYYEMCFAGCISADEAKAKYYFNKAGKILRNDNAINAFRVRAYYEYYINNNSREALMNCENAFKVADKFPSKGQAMMEKGLVEKLILDINTNYS